jgi:hypothetical protein
MTKPMTTETKNAENLEVMKRVADLLRDALLDKGFEMEPPRECFNQGELTHLRSRVPAGKNQTCPVHIYRPSRF